MAYCSLPDMLETSLYPPVKRFLEAAGFCVKGEVQGCDIVAVHDGENLRLALRLRLAQGPLTDAQNHAVATALDAAAVAIERS